MKNFLFIKDDWFYKKYASLSDSRFWTFHIALNHLLQTNGRIIVETGTLRLPGDWEAGQSTLLFGEFCKRYNKHLYTIDIDREALAISKDYTSEFKNYITYIFESSIVALQNFDKPIDLLYLDSVDCDPSPEADNKIPQLHQLSELKAAFDKLSPKCAVLLDDSNFENGGKTLLAKNWLADNGWLCLMDFQQSLFIRRRSS